MDVCVCRLVYIYIHTYIHTYIIMYMYKQVCPKLVLKCKACVPPNNFTTDKKNRPMANNQKIGRYSYRFFFNLSVTFVGENQWKPSDLVVTPNDLFTDNNTKVGGCL